MALNFNTTKEDFKTIHAIVARVLKFHPSTNVMTLTMDLSAVHNSCPLKLQELLAGEDADFFHDIYGIQRHINRKTGELEDCFLPRFANL